MDTSTDGVLCYKKYSTRVTIGIDREIRGENRFLADGTLQQRPTSYRRNTYHLALAIDPLERMVHLGRPRRVGG